MPSSTPYQPLFDRVLAFATAPRFAEELQAARATWLRASGETFEEDASFEARAQAFLDWFVFDRPLSAYGDVPARAYATTPEGRDDALALVAMSRTVHGLFVATGVRPDRVAVLNVPTTAAYEVIQGVEGLRAGDLFEARLVPWQGRYCFSPAFLFHPPQMRARLEKHLRRGRRTRQQPALQELTWTMARMASRAEHYPKVPLDTIYDFDKPPPMFDRPARKSTRAVEPGA